MDDAFSWMKLITKRKLCMDGWIVITSIHPNDTLGDIFNIKFLQLQGYIIFMIEFTTVVIGLMDKLDESWTYAHGWNWSHMQYV